MSQNRLYTTLFVSLHRRPVCCIMICPYVSIITFFSLSKMVENIIRIRKFPILRGMVYTIESSRVKKGKSKTFSSKKFS